MDSIWVPKWYFAVMPYICQYLVQEDPVKVRYDILYQILLNWYTTQQHILHKDHILLCNQLTS